MIQVIKWDIHPDKVQEYEAWARSVVPRLLAIPGLIEFRAYGPIAGSTQVVTTYEFEDLAAWITWNEQEEVRAVVRERRTLTINEYSELWGPSPIIPAALHSEMYLP